MKKKCFLLMCLITAVLLCSCGPNTTDATLHIDEDVVVTKVVLGKITSGITIEVMQEYTDLELKKGDTLVCPVYKGYYGFFVLCDKSKSVNYKGTKDYFNRYNRITLNVEKGKSYDVYLSETIK